jgi:hypothetical protein
LTEGNAMEAETPKCKFNPQIYRRNILCPNENGRSTTSKKFIWNAEG